MPEPSRDEGAHRSNVFCLLSAASVIVLLDRFTKILICGTLSQGQSLQVLPYFFHITPVFNSGAAFGLFKNGKALFVSLAISALIFIGIYMRYLKRRDALISIALGLISGGAIGNLIDRVQLGYVVDFLDFRIWPVFNIADSSITIGAVLLAAKFFYAKKPGNL